MKARTRKTAVRSRADTILRFLSEGTALAQGQDFFRSLVRSLVSVLRARTAFVAEFTDAEKTRVRTLVFWHDGGFAQDISYSVSGTPCERVLRGQTCVYATNVRGLFPKDDALVRLKADGYLGVPIRGSSGAVLGHLAVLDKRPLRAGRRELSTLRIFAGRAGVELERKRAEDAVRRYTQRLEILKEMDRAILSTRSPATIGQAAMQHVRQLIPCLVAAVTVFDFLAGEGVVQAVHAEGEGKIDVGQRLPLEAFGSLPALRDGQVNIVHDATFPGAPNLASSREEGLRWTHVPLIGREHLIGALSVGSGRLDALSSEEVDALRPATGPRRPLDDAAGSGQPPVKRHQVQRAEGVARHRGGP